MALPCRVTERSEFCGGRAPRPGGPVEAGNPEGKAEAWKAGVAALVRRRGVLMIRHGAKALSPGERAVVEALGGVDAAREAGEVTIGAAVDVADWASSSILEETDLRPSSI